MDTRSSTPIYSQIKDQLHLAVATGVLQPGDQLPTVRDLATQLRVNPNTVARAYRELQAEGMLNSRQGSGTFVSEKATAVGEREQRRLLQEMLMQAAATAANLGLSPQEFRDFAERGAQAIEKAFQAGEEVSDSE